MNKYELIICWADMTWTDGNYLFSEKDNLTREEVEQEFLCHHPLTDVVYIGIYNIEEIDYPSEMTQSEWNKMSEEDRIEYLHDEFATSIKEATEILCDNINDLPDEIKGYMNLEEKE